MNQLTISSLHVAIIVLTVLFALALPYVPTHYYWSTCIRVMICVLIIVLCVCLPKTIGIPLALLLVLSSIPTLQILPVHGSTVDHEQTTETFSNEDDGKKKEQHSHPASVVKMGQDAIAEKMNMFTRINTKQDEFKKQLKQIDQNLKEVKEFYANETKKNQKRGSGNK